MIRKNKKLFRTLNDIEHFLVLPSTTTVCISVSAFASLLSIRIGITSSEIVLNYCAIAAGIKKYKSKIKKKKKKHSKIMLSVKSKLNSTEVLTCNTLVDSSN